MVFESISFSNPLEIFMHSSSGVEVEKYNLLLAYFYIEILPELLSCLGIIAWLINEIISK
jgi:hypothetical protein